MPSLFESIATMSVDKEPERIDYQPEATFASDLQVLKSMIFADVRGDTQVYANIA